MIRARKLIQIELNTFLLLKYSKFMYAFHYSFRSYEKNHDKFSSKSELYSINLPLISVTSN